MKILIANDGRTAHYYIRLGLARAFSALGHEVIMWEIGRKPTHDAFDELEPDIFIGQAFNLTPTIIEAILERPHLKVILKAGDWGPLTETIDTNEYQILKASQKEIDTVKQLLETCGQPEYIFIHHHPNWLYDTHGYWKDNGIPIQSHMCAADIFDYTNGEYREEFDTDLVFVGGYWPYKAKIIDKYLMPLCLDYTYRIKIFGNSHWPVPQYCGFIPNEYVKHALASAKICPCLSEPHSKFGYEICERPFKLLANKCFIISDYIEGLAQLFPNSITYVDSPEGFKLAIDEALDNSELRKNNAETGFHEVINQHTYFHRIRDIFNNLGFDDEAERVSLFYPEALRKLYVTV